MNERSRNIFTIIAEQYIDDAEPVGSQMLVEQHRLDYSSATVRGEMKILEDEGYLTQPHTSAGRILTPKGWKFYVEHLMQIQQLSEKQATNLNEIVRGTKDPELAAKTVARYLSDQLDEAIFVGLDPHTSYYTGLSNLFRKPEFASHDRVINMSEIVDHMDDVLQRLYAKLGSGEVQILIASDSLFGPTCSTIVGKTRNNHVVGIVGPLRMAYRTHAPYLQKTLEFLSL